MLQSQKHTATTLFQTWLEWNDVAVLRDSNPENVATFNAIVEAFEGYEDERTNYRAVLRQRLLDMGFTEGDIINLFNLR